MKLRRIKEDKPIPRATLNISPNTVVEYGGEYWVVLEIQISSDTGIPQRTLLDFRCLKLTDYRERYTT